MLDEQKEQVRAFWEEAACGERLLLTAPDREGFTAQAAQRYRLEPYIAEFAAFPAWCGRCVLEIGVGLGADHQRFAEAGAILSGVDLTARAVALTGARLAAFGRQSELRLADAEHLPFGPGTFDLVYSWGVIHHSPDTPQAVREIWRVLKPGAQARAMIYSKWSVVGLMLWMRYALLRLQPLTGLDHIYAHYLESPGTKAYTRSEAAQLFSAFTDVRIRTVLSHADLLASGAGQRHGGPLLRLMRRLWPRWLIRRIAPSMGLFMLIEATKPAGCALSATEPSHRGPAPTPSPR